MLSVIVFLAVVIINLSIAEAGTLRVSVVSFNMFLRYLSISRDILSEERSPRDNDRDEIADALRQLRTNQRPDIIPFINQHLNSGANDVSLARVFDDGNTYCAWCEPGGRAISWSPLVI